MTTDVAIEIATNAEGGELAAWRLAVKLLTDIFEGQREVVLTPYSSPEAALASSATLVALTLHGLLEAEEDFVEIEARWERACATIKPGRVVFVSTILRYWPDGPSTGMAHLRRLTLLAIRLSQRYGLLVIDIDRVLAHRGALALATDAHLGGVQGQEAAARLMAQAVLYYGLADLIEDGALDRAIVRYEADGTADMGPLTVPSDQVQRRATKIGARKQVHIVHSAAVDERTLKGLLRDVRHGRIAPWTGVCKISGKVMKRLFHAARITLGDTYR
jgi:hypothetical protein